MKILNLYAGLGGNRKLWEGHDITAIEIDEAIAENYKANFPSDEVICTDAHDYLINHLGDYDFIWASPPCPTHGQYRYNVGFRAKGYKPVYPDMKLYEEILLLKYYSKVPFVVENVKPFYEPLVAPTAIVQRHLIWSNRDIASKQFPPTMIRTRNKISDYDDLGFSTDGVKNKRQALRNCLSPEVGKYILDEVMR